MSDSSCLDPQYHREPGSKWPGFLVNRSGLPINDQTWNQVGTVTLGVLTLMFSPRSGSLPPIFIQKIEQKCNKYARPKSCQKFHWRPHHRYI